MAVLSDADRQAITNQYMSDESNTRRPSLGSKADQRAMVDSIDNWWDTRETGFLNSFPPATKGISDAQKITLLLAVLRKRSGV